MLNLRPSCLLVWNCLDLQITPTIFTETIMHLVYPHSPPQKKYYITTSPLYWKQWLCHVAMVANFSMTTNRKYHLKREFALFQTYVLLISFNLWKCSQNFLGLSLKEKFFCLVFTYSKKRARDIRNHAMTTRKCTKNRDACSKFLFC